MTYDDQGVEDARLIAVYRSGKPGAQAAFTSLVEQHQGWVVRYLTHLLGGHDDAHDVAQETFARAFTSLGSLRDPGTFRAWVRRIATRLAFNFQRDRRTRRTREHESWSAEDVRDVDRLAERQAIIAALEKLPYIYREVLVLLYVEELPVSQIAEMLDIGSSAAKMRLSRARKEFKDVYGKQTTA